MPDEDPVDALLARFKALSTPAQVIAPKEADEVDDADGGDATSNVDEDEREISDADVEAYLSAFPSVADTDSTAVKTPSLPEPIRKKEMRDLIKSSQSLSQEASEFLPAQEGDTKPDSEPDDDNGHLDESAIVRRALEAAALEPPSPTSLPINLKQKSSSAVDHLALLASLTSPSAISDEEPPDPLASRFPILPSNLSSFILPDVPKHNLKSEAESFRSKKFGLPGWSEERDNDLTSWCCICNADATLICISCDSDPYCAVCWKEGHGPEDGKEEGHRVKKFER